MAEERGKSVRSFEKGSQSGKDRNVAADPPLATAAENIPNSKRTHDEANPKIFRTLQGVPGIIKTPEIAPETEEELKARRDLNEAVHRMLILGLVLSIICLFAGLALSAVSHHPLPSKVSGFRQVFDGLRKASPASFLDLGILLLIATPVLRVFGSLVEFAAKRDWRYVFVTSVVLTILAISVVFGKG